MSAIFDRMGYAVRTSEEGFAALSEIRSEQPDVILSDLNMPRMSGFELLSVVRRRFPGIQVIAMSGAFSGESLQPGVAADMFYAKGTGISTLLEMMAGVTGPQRQIREQLRTPTPFWIQRDEDGPAGETYVTISCPECLRTFRLLSGAPVGDVNIHEMPCVYCSATIHFAIIHPANPSSPQAFQRRSI